jgi:hypothetical protein
VVETGRGRISAVFPIAYLLAVPARDFLEPRHKRRGPPHLHEPLNSAPGQSTAFGADSPRQKRRGDPLNTLRSYRDLSSQQGHGPNMAGQAGAKEQAALSAGEGHVSASRHRLIRKLQEALGDQLCVALDDRQSSRSCSTRWQAVHRTARHGMAPAGEMSRRGRDRHRQRRPRAAFGSRRRPADHLGRAADRRAPFRGPAAARRRVPDLHDPPPRLAADPARRLCREQGDDEEQVASSATPSRRASTSSSRAARARARRRSPMP